MMPVPFVLVAVPGVVVILLVLGRRRCTDLFTYAYTRPPGQVPAKTSSPPPSACPPPWEVRQTLQHS